MTRVELYFSIVKTLKDCGCEDIFCSFDVSRSYLANALFELVTSTKDPELAWELLKLNQKCYSDFFDDFDTDEIKAEDINELIDFIRRDSVSEPSEFSY